MMVWNNLTVITVHSHGPGPGLASAFGSLHRCIGASGGFQEAHREERAIKILRIRGSDREVNVHRGYPRLAVLYTPGSGNI